MRWENAWEEFKENLEYTAYFFVTELLPVTVVVAGAVLVLSATVYGALHLL